jgi:hypothetical protein
LLPRLFLLEKLRLVPDSDWALKGALWAADHAEQRFTIHASIPIIFGSKYIRIEARIGAGHLRTRML